jgi:hypothetical protein
MREAKEIVLSAANLRTTIHNLQESFVYGLVGVFTVEANVLAVLIRELEADKTIYIFLEFSQNAIFGLRLWAMYYNRGADISMEII